MPLERQREVSDGTLLVRVGEDGSNRVVALAGELDLANAGTAKAELDAARAADSRVVVDLSRLEFIDSTGIALLVDLIGGDTDSATVGFVPSEFAAVTRVLELTGVAERMAPAEPPPG